jgi:uncharacterized protein YabE (DUF348 family)
VTNALVLVALVAGTTAFVNADKSITLTVDGQQQHVHTFARTVGQLLQQQHVTIDSRDVVAPSSTSALADGEVVLVDYARPVKLTVEGSSTKVWTTATTVDEALHQIGVHAVGASLSVSRSQPIPRTGMALNVQLPDRVTFIHDGRKTIISTTAVTVRQALADAGIRVDRNDLVTTPLSSRVGAGRTIVITRVHASRTREPYSIAYGTTRRPTSSLFSGQSKISRHGRPGRGVRYYRVVYHDGVVVKRVLLNDKVLRSPVATVLLYGTAQRPFSAPTTSASSLNWNALALCESGGNPQAVNAYGYYGLYQFTLGTWASVGGSGNPIDASADEQTYRAQLLYESRGDEPWPVCGHLLYS